MTRSFTVGCVSTRPHRRRGRAAGAAGEPGGNRRLPGYHAAAPDTLQRRFLNTGGIIENDGRQTTIRLARRTYSPIVRQATLPETITVPWREGRTLRYQYD